MALPEPHILRYTRWLRDARGLDFDATTNDGYDRLWRWSCNDLTAFWQSVWDYFAIASSLKTSLALRNRPRRSGPSGRSSMRR